MLLGNSVDELGKVTKIKEDDIIVCFYENIRLMVPRVSLIM